MTLLAIEGMTISAGGRTLVDGVSFEVAGGEIVAVIGPNGAGKTTLLEGIVGLRRAAPRDTVRLRGNVIRSFSERASAFAFAPDDAIPPPEVLVATLIDHAAAHRPRDAATCAALRHGLGLEPLLGQSAGVSSRGERKRVALYQALAADRPVVVLDEPFGAFDPLQLRGVVDVVRSIARAGAAVLVSIHQLHEAERIADRVLLLAGGRRVAFGTVAEIRGDAGSLEDAFVSLLSARGGADAA